MSFLDLDERLMTLPKLARIVFTPFADMKSFPQDVDITLVEGAVATSADMQLLRTVRANTRQLVAFGDCAVTGNITAMRNTMGKDHVLTAAYGAQGITLGRDASLHLPALLDQVLPVHRLVDVDVFLPGCPVSPDLIWYALTELLEGRLPEIDREKLRYG
jgi:NAD-reducing hydrogenase small subunit